MTTRFTIVENDAVVEGCGASAIVPWWSFSKTVIAAAALSLVRDGRLGLDAPLPGRRYTLRQLLQHRAGVANYGAFAAYHEAVARGDPPWPESVLLRLVEADRLRYEPGRDWSYSNVGYLFVRRLIEEATGEHFAEALARLVLAPLRIEASFARVPADLDRVMGVRPHYHTGWVYHGLLVGSLDEAALLLHRLMAAVLLPPDLLGQMREAHPLGGPTPGRPWKAPGYGLGLMSGGTTRGLRAEGHTGGGPDSVVAVYHFPDASPGRTVAVFTPGDDQALVEAEAFERAAISDVHGSG